MSRARNIVISMPELLEHTLTHLPMHDLLVAAPLVSKRWQAITLSPALQRALFFEPDFSVAEYIRNPLLVEMFPPFFAAPLVEEYERDEEDEEFEDDEGYEDCQLSWPGQSPALLAMPWARVPESFKRADASWRRMLVTQPPTQTMRVTHHTHSMDGGTGESRALLPDFSLRMGALYDLAVPFVDHADSNFYIRWPGHNGHDLKGDLTLAFCSTAGCMPREEKGHLMGDLRVKEGQKGRVIWMNWFIRTGGGFRGLC